MKCERCGAIPWEGATLIRQNPKGEVGVWRCESCGRCKSAERALSLAASDMDGFHRARVLFIDISGYYDPRVVMEAVRK